ncbi:MAG: hypothetical protein BGP13_10860 [Sphingobacteriales bacterium 40-81]|nr:MAG: hypothetical protein BGP13_10860 [Sphingobacteriales bacterium 40-81]
MISKSAKVLLGVLFNSFLFGFVLIFFHSLFNSADDAICLYILGGGFGFPQSEFLYYNHVLHPIITLPVKFLFNINPNINWYAGCLIIFHFFATSLIFIHIIRCRPFWESLFIYTCIFFIFECAFLMSLSFTNTSIVLTWAGLTSLFFGVKDKRIFNWNGILALSSIFFAVLFRIHVIIPFIVIVLPFFLFRVNTKIVIRLIILITCMLFLTIFVNLLHQWYYGKYISNWAAGDAYRYKLYKFYNVEGLTDLNIARWETEKQLVKNALIIDTNYISQKKLTEMYEELKMKKFERTLQISSHQMYWSFINNRIYLLAFFLFFFFYSVRRYQKLIALISFSLLATCTILLVVFLKLPYYIIIGGAGLLTLFVVLTSDREGMPATRRWSFFKYSLFAFFLLWGMVRLYKTNIKNKQMNMFFKKSFEEVEKFRTTFFLVTDGAFPLDYFSIFDTPQTYSLENVSLSWQCSYELNLKALNAYHINNVKDIPLSKNVLFWGKPIQALLDYFEITTGKKYCFSDPLKEFKYGEVRRLEECK